MMKKKQVKTIVLTEINKVISSDGNNVDKRAFTIYTIRGKYIGSTLET